MSVLAREHFANTDLTVSAQMARIKASGAQAIITWTSGTPMGTLLHGIKDAGLTLPVTASASNLSYEEFKQFADLLPATLDIAAMPSIALPSLPRGRVRDAVATFVETLRAAGLHADNTHGIAWDPATIVISALRKLGTNATPAQIRDYIATLHGWAGIIGEYDFRDGSQRGVGQNYGIVVRWDPAKDTWVGVSKFGGNI
jgi:branched-chain amino acid transport system substrate-binding protein